MREKITQNLCGPIFLVILQAKKDYEMIESFTIKNYLCYREETEFSFLASKKEGSKKSLPPSWYKEIDGKRILRLLICVGLNGSGKTKMFSALRYLRTLAISRPSKPSEKPIFRPFLLDNYSFKNPTELQLTYYINETCYKYRIKVSNERIEEEELVIKGNRSCRVYLRTHDTKTDKVQIVYGNGCDLSKNDRHDLEINTVANSTVLSSFAYLNLESKILSANLYYFEDKISYVKKGDKSLADKLKTDDREKDALIKKMILRLLKDVNTNICDYEVEEATLNISELESHGAPVALIKAMREQYPSGVIVHKNLKFIHSTSECRKALDSEVESLGTMNIIRLLVVLFDIILGKKSTTVDEVESGIHTKALEFILKMYLSLAKDCQLIVATHDLHILNSSFLRKDAVRLFKKMETGAISVKRPEYIHNTVSFFRTYYREVAPEIDSIISQLSIFEDYERDLFGE